MSKRKISRAICGTSALFILGVVGGIERSLLPLGTGVLWLVFGFVVFVLSALKGGLLK